METKAVEEEFSIMLSPKFIEDLVILPADVICANADNDICLFTLLFQDVPYLLRYIHDAGTRQARYREAREQRKAKLDLAHRYIIEVLAQRLHLEKSVVEEFILDSLSLQAYDDFFSKGGRKSLVFFYQESDPPIIENAVPIEQYPCRLNLLKLAQVQKEKLIFTQSEMQQLKVLIKHVKLVKAKMESQLLDNYVNKENEQLIIYAKKNTDESTIMYDLKMEIEEQKYFTTADKRKGHRKSGRIIAGLVKGTKMMGLFLGNLSDVHVDGLCLFFVRYQNDTLITAKNIYEEASFCVLDCTDGILTGAATMLENIFMPAIATTGNWGALNQSVHGERKKKAFKDIIRRYITFLNGTKASLEKAVVLKSETVDLSQLRSFEQVKAAASNPEMILQIENLLLMWRNQLEQVLAQSNQVRKEAENSGPLTELEYWKCMSAKFNSIIEQLRGQHCKAVINVLKASHSKMLKIWLELDSQITDAANGAKDNVKFLQALEKVCEPLYNSDPVTMTKGVPNLINATQMIHNVSRYYNTSQQMTSLFIKVTNQMVTACKEYITEDGSIRVWDQDSEVIIRKVEECKKLLAEYRTYFQNTKKHTTETVRDTPFDVSEMYIFGKLDVFCKRLAKITEMVEATKTFSVLKNSTIEGIEILAIKYQNIYLNLKKSHYDILDPRKKEFNSDYAVFMKQISDLENLLDDFMSSCFSKMISSRHALQLLQRFQKLGIPSLESEIEITIERILQHYVGELMGIRKHYQMCKENPPLARNMPPIAGKILWVRQLFRRIFEPIDYFYKNSDILKSPQGISIVRMYNKVAYVLVKFEVMHHKAWTKEISTMQYFLHATLLIRDTDTGQMHSNFDHRIVEVLREAKCMLKMGLEIPDIGKCLLKSENALKSNHDLLESVLQSFESVRHGIPSEYVTLITPKIKKIESVLRQGVASLNWSSITLDQFFFDVDAAIHELTSLLKTITDLREMHIDLVLEEIARKIIINLPEDHSLTLEEVVKFNEMDFGLIGLELAIMVAAAEEEEVAQEVEGVAWPLQDQLAAEPAEEVQGAASEAEEVAVQPPARGPGQGGCGDRDCTGDPFEGLSEVICWCRLCLCKETVWHLCQVLADLAPQGRGGHLFPVEVKVTAALNFCASRLFQAPSGDICGISEASVHRCVWQVTDALYAWTCCEEWAEILAPKSKYVETTVDEIVEIFVQISDMALISEVAKPPSEPDPELLACSDWMPFQYDAWTFDPHQLKDVKELYAYFSHHFIDALVRCTSLSLDALKRRIFKRAMYGYSSNVEEFAPFLKAEVRLAIPNVVMVPNLDDIQHAINRTIQMVLDVSRKVIQWRQSKNVESADDAQNIEEISESKSVRQLKNFYHNVAEHKDVTKLIVILSASVNSLRDTITSALERFQKFKMLWLEDRDTTIKKFMDSNPSLYELRTELEFYANIKQEIEEFSSTIKVDFIELNIEPMKMALLVEAKGWIMLLCRFLNDQYRAKMLAITVFVSEQMKNLARPIQDLDDVRFAMESLSQIRNNEIQMDMTLAPIEEAYSILNRYEVEITKEEAEGVDALRYSFNKMQVKARNVQDELVQVQPKFKANLLESVDAFQKEVLKYGRQYEKEGPMVSGIQPAEASTRLQIFQSWFDDLWRKFVTYSSGERLFGLPIQDYEILQKNKKELGLLQKLYSLYDAVMNNINGYYDVLWTDLDIEKINAELLEFQNRCRRLPKGLKEWQAFLDLKKKIDDFSESCPLLEMMSSKSIKPRHWDRISDVTGHTFNVASETFSLKNVMDAPLLQFKDEIEDICISSVKEKDIEAKLTQVMQTWVSQTLSFSQFKTRGELLLKGTETGEIITMMEDSLMILNSLLSNRYNTYYKKDIQIWVHNLTTCTTIIEQWLLVQNLWIYLEAVFVGGDIAKQLPQEAKRFQNVDKSWIKIMQRAHEIPTVVQCCVGDDTMGQLLPHLQEQLEVCQKSLTGYLEKKRLLFPRFFFVSDPTLLEILGQASDSHTIQAHLAGIFDNVNKVAFHPKDYDRMLSVISREGEQIQLDSPVIAKGPVELWLSDLLHVQQASLHTVIKLAYYSFSEPDFQLIPFLYEAPGQVGILAIQILWTRDSEDAIKLAKDSKKIMQTTNQKFLDLLNALISQTTHDLMTFQRIQFETLVTIHVHQRDIFDDLVKMHIRTINDFEWLKQSRVYFRDETQDIRVGITDVEFIYQNEFLGCTDRLVITPLTDRCYITLAQALWMNMGAAPAGPAGTGKTETVKDMGKALGKYVVVFNCSDQMDFRGLGRIFKGLAQSGSWGCFDEFNRIELPVLSVAAQQIYIVLMARKERKHNFIFTDGDNVSLNPEFGIFITMNPGYAGRQELPENLKIQFRTVAMMVPDRQIIIRVKLASVGFLDNVLLSQKFFVLYKLCEEQLTKQVHYDFGLRNILSVLRTLGAQKRARPEDSESTIVMRVLRDMNLSKLVDEDEPLFLSLISDLFPGIQLDRSTYVELQAAVANQVEIGGLVNHPPWNLKLVQLFETARVRHGLMTLGPSGSGKTCVIRTLMQSLTECGAPHREMRMNPKAITAPQMFGRLDPATNDWTDGIFSTLWRKSIKSKKGDNIWIILDGPVDAIWIENLNSVLDDNKTLTLANGDRIPMAPSCKLLFEVHNIENASPATVSRMGMVYISSSALSWKPILKAWLNRRTPWEAEILQGLFDKAFEDSYEYMKLSLNPVMELLECNYIMQSITLLDGLIPSREDGGISDAIQLKRLFVFVLMWSIGALLELESRAKLEQFLQNHSSKLSLPMIPADSNQTMFEYLVNQQGDWEHWRVWVQEYLYPTNSVPDYNSILVPNVDNVRTNILVDIVAKQNKAVLLTGEQGTAKTVMIKGYLKKYDPEEHLSKSLNFSSATEPYMFQRTVESYVEKRVGSTYGPPSGRKMTVFVDDINMPVINEWGDQITNEIVRQMIEMHGMYNLDKPGDFTKIVDVQLMAAMIHPGGGRNDIPQRLKRHFTIFNCTLPTNASIDKIFGIIGNGYFHPARHFAAEISNMITKLVVTGRTLWQWTKVKMLPTPAKFHYIFNLRDLSRVWQGMLTIKAEECTDIETLLALFKHECTRVIADRFVSQEDKYWFEGAITRAVEKVIGRELAGKLHKDPYFVDFLRDMPEPTGDEPEDYVFVVPKVYEMIPSYEFLTEKLQFYQQQHNEGVRSGFFDLVFFKDAMTHLIKISRIIRTDCGNALLVGVGGSGKQSFTKLASYIAGYKIFQITLTRAYNVGNLMDDLKILYRTAGAEGKGITFIFTDNEIKEESFLEYLNNVLSSGEVSNLFARDELDEITQSLIAPMKKEKPRTPPTFDNLYEYFINRARINLHVVLCFSPVGEKFRSRALKFPGLISGCTMDWFSRWPREALVAVSNYFLSDFYIACSDEVKTQLVATMGVFHDRVYQTCEDYFQRYRRRTHITPKSYLAFINSYKSIYTEKHVNINDLAEHMQVGLSKLLEATESVAILANELAQKEKELAVASRNADKVLGEVTVSAQAAEVVKNEVMIVKDKAQKIVDEIEEDKSIAEGKLIAAKPALEAAEAALNTIKPADISTVRKLAKPPHLIMRILDCVLVLFQKKMDSVTMDPERPCLKPSWSESLKLLSGTGFLQALQQFPKDTINEETVELLQPYFIMEDYTFDHAKKVCGNVAGLLSWTQAMASFFAINKEVLPLKANLAVQENRLQRAMKELSTAQAQLDEKQAELDKVQAKFDAAMKQKMDLLEDAETCRRKMEAASALIDGLSGERIRWTDQCKEFKAQLNRLVGDVLLATGFLSYSGPFNQTFRDILFKVIWEAELQKKKIPYSDSMNVINFLVDQPTISEWNLQGLPSDDLSVQNGIIVTKATRYPLLIDPQTQGKTWIKRKEKHNELQVTSLNHKYFRNHLEDSLSLGRPLLLEDVQEELDPALDNVLEKNFIKSGTSFKVKVGDKETDVMAGFMFYITTKLPNPAYTPEISAKTSIIDFTVTIKGLENQLLGRVILTEKQELEAERVQLIEEVTANKRKMKELENNLLFKLSTTKGSLVDDESLIGVLQITKTTATEVSEKLHVAAETEVKINTAQEEYRPAATRGSILYFLITEMSMVNIMYQTSLAQFLKLFDFSMARSKKSPVAAKRIRNIIDYLTYEVFKYSVRGLYETHKFLFTLLLPLKINLERGFIKHNEFQTLIKGGAALDLKASPQKPFRWILDMTWLNLVELSKLSQFAEILTQVTKNEKVWKVWFDANAPEEAIIPHGYSDSLDSFCKLLLIRSWCPDRTLSQARNYISDAMGAKYAEPVILNLETTWEESDTQTPLICFLSMGSDPSNQIEGLAKKLEIDCRAMSMGQGQEVHARKLVALSMHQGGWVLLQNCHLGLEFMNELLETLLTSENVHDSFRVWITTEPHPRFPITLLQTSIKYTNEPPQGVRAGLKRTFTGISQDQIEYSNLPMWKPLLYAVAFLHTTVQERRKFGPLGWCIPYEFNSSDFTASVQFIQNHLDDCDKKKGVSWTTIRYMLGEVQYGGRVTDDYDKRLLNCFCKVWFSEKTFDPKFSFYTDYIIPVCASIENYLEYIQTLPAVDTPQVFGLHPNADITYQSNTAAEILNTITNIQPKESSGGGGETREASVFKLAGSMLKKLPPDYLAHEVKACLVKMGILNSMNIFLRQEIDRMQKVITMLRNCLTDLQLAIEGTIIMSENLTDALDNMYNARVPVVWKRISWDSSTLGFWFTEFLERNAQFSTWIFEGRPNVFWMTGFFNPQGFLTAMRQEVTRAHKGWALDSVTLHNEVTKLMRDEIKIPPPEGVYIYGLYLDGAGWDRRNIRLTESTAKVLFTMLPVIYIFAINSTAPKDPKLYICPVYKKTQRTDLTFITTLCLKTVQTPDHWILRGAALLCDIK
ncbi:dynein axonemal heavy chain 8-like [Mustelus asterias]